MSAADEFLDAADAHRRRYAGAGMSARPSRRVAVVGCMDARVNFFDILGLEVGDAHIIRNAGGVVTDDVIRSLTISQRFLGTEEIVLVHHTLCGMLGFTEDEFRAELAAEVGQRPTWAAETFSDLDADVRQSMERIRTSPFLRSRDVRGFVYDVESGELREVR
jgi:carbonic anhydrase